MRSFISAMVIAASLALLVPDNGAQAVNAAEGRGVGIAPSSVEAMQGPTLAGSARSDRDQPVDGDAALLLALGFLGAVTARRLRAD
jgi:hypothetical protein